MVTRTDIFTALTVNDDHNINRERLNMDRWGIFILVTAAAAAAVSPSLSVVLIIIMMIDNAIFQYNEFWYE
jgi:hypothetical protein